MSNPGWFDGMAGWNITTECKEWTEDWRPCSFPYTGLSAYRSNPEYCHETFAESLPSDYVYRLGQLIYSVSYLPFLLIFANRVIYMLVDLKVISVPFYAKDNAFARNMRIINIHDQCNILTLLGVIIQSIRFIDLHAWRGVIPFTAYKVMGRLVRSLIVTTAAIIIKIWMNLISFWSSSTPNSVKNITLRRDIKLMNWFVVLTWTVLLPVELYSILYTRDNCHEGCTNAQVSCGSGIIISFLTIAAMILASRYVYLTYLVFQKIKTDGVHGCFSTRFNEDDKSRSTSTASSLDDGMPTMAPFHIRPSSEGVSDEKDPDISLGERTTSSSFSVRNSDISLTEDLRNISAALTKDIDAIIWKRISRLSVFITCLYLAAIGGAMADCSLCISSAKETFLYSSPPCENSDVFTRDINLVVCIIFYVAVAIYIPPRHKALVESITQDENPQDLSDTVIRCSELGPSPEMSERRSEVSAARLSRMSRVSIAF